MPSGMAQGPYQLQMIDSSEMGGVGGLAAIQGNGSGPNGCGALQPLQGVAALDPGAGGKEDMRNLYPVRNAPVPAMPRNFSLQHLYDAGGGSSFDINSGASWSSSDDNDDEDNDTFCESQIRHTHILIAPSSSLSIFHAPFKE